jgi:hypothetical protein
MSNINLSRAKFGPNERPRERKAEACTKETFSCHPACWLSVIFRAKPDQREQVMLFNPLSELKEMFLDSTA